MIFCIDRSNFLAQNAAQQLDTYLPHALFNFLPKFNNLGSLQIITNCGPDLGFWLLLLATALTTNPNLVYMRFDLRFQGMPILEDRWKANTIPGADVVSRLKRLVIRLDLGSGNSNININDREPPFNILTYFAELLEESVEYVTELSLFFLPARQWIPPDRRDVSWITFPNPFRMETARLRCLRLIYSSLPLSLSVLDTGSLEGVEELYMCWAFYTRIWVREKTGAPVQRSKEEV